MKLIGYILAFFTGLSSIAQTLEGKLLQDEIKIGEQATYVLTLIYQDKKGDAKIAWPTFDENLTDYIEIVDQTIDYETLEDSAASRYKREQKLFLTAFEEGKFRIPPFQVELNDSVLTTNSNYLLVNTVEVDTSKGIYGNFQNYQTDYTFKERVADFVDNYGFWFLLLMVPIILWLGYKLYKKYLKKEDEPEPEIKIPAHITALAKLMDLKTTEAWKREDKKGYYSELTDTVRRYLEERFSIYAMEQTTREIIQNLLNADISENDKQFLRGILAKADMVKFAKFKPNEADAEVALNQSIDFIQRTKKEEEIDE